MANFRGKEEGGAATRVFPCLAHYALFCIRGDTEDLRNMIDVLKQGNHKYWIARFLVALGVKAKPMANEARQMLKQKAFAEFHERIRLFLKRVEHGRGPEAIVHW